MKKQIHPNIRAHVIRSAFCVLLLLGMCAIPFALAQRNAPSQSVAKPTNIIVVTNTNDSGPGSLRDALAAANDSDTIDATGVSGTILLISGELQITHNVTINGPGAGNLAVNGNATFRVFENFASNVTISGFTITDGSAGDENGGGGILNHGGLTLSDNSIVNNHAFTRRNDGIGGGISNSSGAALTVTGCTINDNVTDCEGGGIYSSNAQLTLMDSTISGNSAQSFGPPCVGFGGGIFSSGGKATVTDSTVNGNTAFAGGGGIRNDGGGTLTIIDSTISENTAYFVFGGGISNDGNLTLTNSTMSGNSAPQGGAIHNEETTTIGDTLLNAGASGGTINGTATSLGYNLASDDGGGVLTGLGDQINTDPMLGPLQNNGGPTFTHALLPGSPAIDTGDPNFTPPPFFDQRGPNFVRIFGGRIDIGSFEVQPVRASPTPRPRPTPAPRPLAQAFHSRPNNTTSEG
jgi:hypothetical protein